VRPLFRHLVAAARIVRAVMRRWGISQSNVQVSPGANSRAVGKDRAQEALCFRASSIGVDVLLTPLDSQGNSGAGAIEQRDLVQPALSQSGGPLR
jgi:hypothetical protein